MLSVYGSGADGKKASSGRSRKQPHERGMSYLIYNVSGLGSTGNCPTPREEIH
jgi:hypothetical protein